MTLSPDLRLRVLLANLPVGDSIEHNGHTITRDQHRFILTQGGRETRIPHKCFSTKSEFYLRRVVGMVIAHLFGDEYAPELRYKNVTRRGARFEAWHLRYEWQIVLYADSAEAAHDEYLSWKRVERKTIHDLARGMRRMGR